MIIAIAPPIKNIISEKIKYKVPISLWLVEKIQRFRPDGA
jgi:hypothetical protein